MVIYRAFSWLVLVVLLLSGCRYGVENEVSASATVAVAQPTTERATTTTSSPNTGSTPTPTPMPTTTPQPVTPPVPTPNLPTLRDNLPQTITTTAVTNDAGFPLIRISHPETSFRSRFYCDGPYRWLDNGHLLLYPIVDYTTWFEEPTGGEVTLPVVWDLSGEGEAWTTAVATDRCKLPVYSAALDRLIDVVDGQAQLFTLDGQPDADTYPGTMPLTLAPSGLRLLAGYEWIDLENGVSQPLQPTSSDRFFWRPRWSADERQVVQCCVAFADATTGAVWRPNNIDDIFFGGMGIGPGGRPGGGEHLLLDETGQLRGLLFEVQASFLEGGVYNPIPLIDPATRTYVDLRPELGLVDESLNCALDVAPDNAHAWVQCHSFDDWQLTESLLVDLQTAPLRSESLPQAEIEGWSPDGRFLVYFHHGDQTYRLREVATGTETELVADPGDQTWIFRWSPAGDLLTYWLPVSRTLWLHDPVQAETWSAGLPADVADWTFAPTGAQIAVQGMDDRLYLLTPAREPQIQPLTPAIPGIHTVGWSPAEDQIAFGDETAVYVVALVMPTDWQPVSALNATFRMPPGWEQNSAAEALTLIDRVQVGAGAYPYRYFIDVRSHANPENKEFVERVTVNSPSLQSDFSYETIQIGPYTTYWTDDMPSAEGALTVFFDDEAAGRFLAFSLNPYHPIGKYPYQDAYESLFRLLLDSVRLSPVAGLSNGQSSSAVISGDGQMVAFVSDGRLTDHGGGSSNAYLRDMANGITNLISLRSDGTRTPFPVYTVALSGNGRVLAYYSLDDQLVPGDTEQCGESDYRYNCEDLFVFDFDTGITERIPLGRNQGLGSDYTVALSVDGRFLAYSDNDSATNVFQLMLYDRKTGEERPLLTTATGQQPNVPSYGPQFTEDNSIAFTTDASLVPEDGNGLPDVYVWDSVTETITRVSVATAGVRFAAISGAAVAISGNGRYVAFLSLADNLTADPIAQCDDYRGFQRTCSNLYLHDRETGETLLITKGMAGVPMNGDAVSPALSADGRFLVFTSTASNLTADTVALSPCSASVNCGQIYLFDREQGALTLISRSLDDTAGNGGSWGSDISGDGRYITFVSSATNLVSGDTNMVDDIFRYDRVTATMEIVSLANQQ